ncbi:hypothetical protein NQZ68_026129 [Dissostichus eleginoides]|nr:hypothetical protein NQZ68_026129 [Dissostichus eleginoides]
MVKASHSLTRPEPPHSSRSFSLVERFSEELRAVFHIQMVSDRQSQSCTTSWLPTLPGAPPHPSTRSKEPVLHDEPRPETSRGAPAISFRALSLCLFQLPDLRLWTRKCR